MGPTVIKLKKILKKFSTQILTIYQNIIDEYTISNVHHNNHKVPHIFSQ